MDSEKLDINAVCFGILCNFTPICGEERAKEAAGLVRALQAENAQLRAERVGLEAALTQARAELAAIRRYQIAGCAAGLRGPVPECPRCGSHVIEWDAETDTCKCGDCGWSG